MKLVSPIGVRIRVSDEKGEQLLKQGYDNAEVFSETSAPPVKRVRRTRKGQEDVASDA